MNRAESSWCVDADPATASRVALLLNIHPSLQLSVARYAPLSQTGIPALQEHILRVDQNRLTLFACHEPRWSGITVDFLEGAMAHRRRQAIGGEQVVKAVWGRGKGALTVLDATAGLGRDGFLLAASGAQVTLCERHPAVALLLADGLWRAAQEPTLAEVLAKLNFHHGSAFEQMECLKPDVIYLDPMFPEREKSALVKKEMRAFRGLVGEDSDAQQLFDGACQHAKKRVVVKRPSSGEFLGRKPTHTLEGKSNRFDVYAMAENTSSKSTLPL